jgi:ribosomal protein S3
MKKYLVECTYIKNSIKWIDISIIKSYSEYLKADYKIRQFLNKKYENYQITDIRINPLDILDQYTVK